MPRTYSWCTQSRRKSQVTHKWVNLHPRNTTLLEMGITECWSGELESPNQGNVNIYTTNERGKPWRYFYFHVYVLAMVQAKCIPISFVDDFESNLKLNISLLRSEGTEWSSSVLVCLLILNHVWGPAKFILYTTRQKTPFGLAHP